MRRQLGIFCMLACYLCVCPVTSGQVLSEDYKLLASDGLANDNYGVSVAVDGNVAVVGAYLQGVTTPGAVYVYRFDGVSWIEETKLLASDAATGDYFGISVDI